MLSAIMEAVLERTWKEFHQKILRKKKKKKKKTILKSMIVVASECGGGTRSSLEPRQTLSFNNFICNLLFLFLTTKEMKQRQENVNDYHC